ncbi:sensor histidine kinase [Paractinoplanes lichenicola]|uniref:Sensor-like histidine kinase SenX3 n=1 Tax=Paractinoplanes lichenicola TaxID=2802976 RepID=A0ABS1VWK1_9ACTN|nr:sensor histidine kinase [Actinoplanes lichenicola]MBL7258835.1 PAS domain S-box protein [Actinoplanes lichenicola]
MRGLREWWRSAVVPLVVWLLLVVVGSGVLLWQQNDSRQAVAERFEHGVGTLGDFMTGVATEVLTREKIQAQASLADPVVAARDFERAVAGFGYPSALLLDSQGRVLHVSPADPKIVGTDIAVRYAHLREALQGRPAVSGVVDSAAAQIPVVAFAVPFETGQGRRVFSGAVPIRASPLATYFTSALSLTGARVQLVDTSGNIVAGTEAFTTSTPTLAEEDEPLAAALTQDREGRYLDEGHWWRYSSVAVKDTPWRLSATVSEDVLFGQLHNTEYAGLAALGGAALVGLAVVVAVGRARSSRRELLLSERRFRKVFETSRIGMVLTDPQGRCLRLNPASSQIFGLAEDDLLDKSLIDYTHPDDAGLTDGPVRDCVAGRTDGFDLDKRYLRADGQVVEASITAAVIRDEEERPLYFATQIIDVTERNTLERERARALAELADRAEQLQDANTHLADVMAMLSHDVRQPLAKIVGLGGLVVEEWAGLPEHTKVNYVQRMTAAGHRANDLVTDILMLAQFDAGAMMARPVRLDVSHAVREAVSAFHLSSGTPISVIAPDETTGLADPGQLQLILGNLMTNASKYGRPPIVVTVANTGELVAISVADHGEGVPAEFVPHLFDRFARAGSGVATTTAGTGLGLYLVRQLAQAGGLDVSYEPNQPNGAVFTVTVPRTSPTSRMWDSETVKAG